MNEHSRFHADDRIADGLLTRPDRHFEYLAIRVPNAWWSAAFTFGLSGCALATAAAGQRSGVVGYLLLVGLLIAFFPHFALRANLRNAWLWLFPFWATLSTAWSINPDRTFHSVLLLFPTIAAALAIGAMPARRWVNAGGACALLLYMIYSFAKGGTSVFFDTSGEQSAMVGVLTSKNFFGHIAAMSTIMAFALFGLGGRLARAGVLLGLADLLISVVALLRAHATGSLLATVMGLAVGALVLLFRHVGWQLRTVMVAAIVGLLVLYLTFGQEIQDQLYGAVLQTFNKDTGLSGRHYLWEFTDRLIAERFILGYGYNSFWFYTNPDAWTIWRMMGIAPMGGFNFHNEYRETLIDGGAIGLALLVGGFLYSLVRTAAASLKDGSYAAALRMAYITYFLVRTGVESTGFGSVTIDTTLLFAFVCLPLTGRRHAPVAPREEIATRRGSVSPVRLRTALRH